MSRRRERQSRERQERELWESVATPEQRLVRSLVPYIGVLLFLAGMGLVTEDGKIGVPLLATAIFWGMGIVSGYLRRKQAAGAGVLPEPVEQGAGESVPAPVPTASSSTAPSSAPPLASPGAPPQLPAALAELGEDVARVAAGLRKHGRGKVAVTVEHGLVEVARLAALAELAVSGPDADGLTAEIAGLRARAAATGDPEAAALWERNARAAERRLDKVLALAAAAERTHARIEAYRQTVKSLAVDLARLELVGEAAADLPAVDDHAAAVELEVEALTRTHAELARLERGEGAAPVAPPAPAARPSPAEPTEDADAARERARRSRAGQGA